MNSYKRNDFFYEVEYLQKKISKLAGFPIGLIDPLNINSFQVERFIKRAQYLKLKKDYEKSFEGTPNEAQ